MKLVPQFRNVNEDGEPYGLHDNLEDAMKFLEEFPNDSIVITMTSVPDKICIGCDQPRGEPHKEWCPVVTGTLNSLKEKNVPLR